MARMLFMILGVALSVIIGGCSSQAANVAGDHATPPSGPNAAPKAAEFRPALSDRISKLPPADSRSLIALLDALYKTNAPLINQTGGHNAFIAGLAGYVPTDDELIASELGQRIEYVLSHTPPEEIDAIVIGYIRSLTPPGEIGSRREIFTKYKKIVLNRANVAGTGVVIYAQPPTETTIWFARTTPR